MGSLTSSRDPRQNQELEMISIRAALFLYFLLGLASCYKTTCSGQQICVSLLQCEEVQGKVAVLQSSLEARRYLRKMHCGWEGKWTKICCDSQYVRTGSP